MSAKSWVPGQHCLRRLARVSSIENRARSRILASEPREDDIHYDLTIEKLEIARTVGMVSGFDAHPMGVTVRRTAHVSEAELRNYLEPLLRGLVAQQAIVIEEPLSDGESIQRPVCWQPAESGSAARRRPSYVDALATAGAMLTCAAVVLNLVPYGNTPKPPPERVPAASLFEVESPPASAAQAAARPEPLQSVSDPSEPAKPATTAAQSALPTVERAHSAEEAKAQGDGLQERLELSVLARLATTGGQFSLASVDRVPSTGEAKIPGEDPQQGVESLSLAKLATTAAQFSLASADWGSSAAGANTQREGVQQSVEALPAVPNHADHADPAAMTRSTIVGVWAPDAGTCSAERFRDGVLPTVITLDGAWAGDTFCLFTKQQQTEDGLRVVAKCSNPRERWTSQVRLTVSDHRLTWSSKRGVQAYARCTPDLLMASKR